MYEKITKANVNMFAIRHYENPHCESETEFNDDMKRFKYIKRLLRKYHETYVLKERLLLNHIIVLNNLFGPDACVTLLLFKIQPDYWKALKSFLLFLNLLREGEMSDIVEDENVLDTLRKL
jgi:hypothetical protein|tara:strand:- start:2860 stop:3222 length:363 start_codon:yes stop_codon:yes gene_type:complete